MVPHDQFIDPAVEMARPLRRWQVEAPVQSPRDAEYCKALTIKCLGLASLPFPGHPKILQGSCEGEVLVGWGLWWVGCRVIGFPELALASPHLLRPSGEAFMGCQPNTVSTGLVPLFFGQ